MCICRTIFLTGASNARGGGGRAEGRVWRGMAQAWASPRSAASAANSGGGAGRGSNDQRVALIILTTHKVGAKNFRIKNFHCQRAIRISELSGKWFNKGMRKQNATLPLLWAKPDHPLSVTGPAGPGEGGRCRVLKPGGRPPRAVLLRGVRFIDQTVRNFNFFLPINI